MVKTDIIKHTFPDTDIETILRHTFLNEDFQIRFLKHKQEVSTVNISSDWKGSSSFNKNSLAIGTIFKRKTSAVVDKINAPSILGIKRVDLLVTESLTMKSKTECHVECDIALVGESPMKEAFSISCIFKFDQKKENNFQSVDLTIEMKAEFKKEIWAVTDFVENALIKNENKIFCKWIEMSYDVIPCIYDGMDVENAPLEQDAGQGSSSKKAQPPTTKKPSVFMSLKNLLKKKKKDGTQNETEKKAEIFIKHVGYEEAIKKTKEKHQEMFGMLAQKQENAYFIIFFSVIGIVIGLFLFTFLSSFLKN
ncbi:hypothetical protein FDP41_009054 [Naegleria fowleri]|uniref:VASt domain-containing protein n=1 Tax=Naegleria fowleri TaxID=5763 RepID=A0A6A5BFJ8_NAEFO|nr:uncharacterized protein FDP41_009054 [Naegleria fowleri]KAF0972805.1 hypothetical protein FDP41_009054 [Naegleria fowleri]CAG4710431.1 unnamed protein product [Naegleria fowleri]